MDVFQRVVWSEGMFLTPHHFQQWDRYYEKTLTDRLHLLSPFGWGCAEINIDTDGLANGTFALLRLLGVMPDGLPVNIPAEDPSPQTRPIGDHFAPTMDHLDVYLGIAAEHPGSANISIDDQADTQLIRYFMKTVKTSDDNTGKNIREISVARKNWKLFFSGEVMSDYTTLKIAELVRTTGGTILLRETYVPPCLSVGASPYLMKLARSMLDILSAKSKALESVRRDITESAPVDAAKLSLLKTVNASIPFLAHTCHAPSIHPEALYLMLSRLVGELTTFSADLQAKDIAPYHHDNLSQSFRDLERKIRLVAEGVSAEYVVIPLEKSRQHVWGGQVPDDGLFETSQFYLVVSCDLSANEVGERIPMRIKAGSAQELDLIVSTAMPGVRLYHNPRPPSRLPLKEGRHYFRLDDHGSFWDAVSRSKSISFYVPTDLKGLELELIAMKE